MKAIKSNNFVLAVALLTFSVSDIAAASLGTAFSYQGRLTEGTNAANGSYDLTFALFDASDAGSQAGTTITNMGVGVTDGVFTVLLDFGNQFNGAPYWLEIGVRASGNGAFTTLRPRQELTPTPYAILANSASNLLGTLGGDVTGTQGATVVGQIRGTPVSATGPSADQFLRYDGSQWTPGSVALDTDTTGTLADAHLSSNVGLLNANQTFSGSNGFSGVVQLTNTANTLAGSFIGNGGGLTGLNPASLSVGTAGIDISGNAATATSANTATSAATAAIAGTATNFTGSLAGDVTGTQGATVVGQIRGTPVSATGPSADQFLRYDGSQWTPGSVALDTDTTGTLADAHLSSNVGLLNANQTFSGSNGFSGVVQLTNTANTLAGSFIGNGGGLTGLNPASLSVGTAGIDISGNAATATSANTATSAATAAIAGTATNFTGSLAGDVTGTQGATVVGQIRGTPVSATGPSADQFLRYDGSQWTPGSVALDTDTTGTLADAHLSSNVGLLNANQTFSGSNGFSGVVQLTNTANTLAGSFIGNGGGLTGLNPASLSVGTAGIDISGNAATATSANTATSAATAAIAGTATNFTGSLAGDVTGTQGATVVGQIRGTPVSATGPSADQFLRYDGSQWTPGSVALDTDTTGILADAHLSSDVGLLNANQTFSGSNWFSGVVQLTNTANTLAGSFIGNGGALTGLNPASLAAGTAPISISGNAATATSAATAGSAGTATSFSGLLAGDVTGPQGATVVASVGGQSAAQVASGASAANGATAANTPDTLVRRDSAGNFAAGAITVVSVSGDGSGLAALNASQLDSGTLADARLSTNVALLNAPQTFSGSNVFAGVVQLTNTNNAFVGTVAGNGGGLSNLSVSAANVLGQLPASQLSGTLPSGLLAGTYSNPLAFNNAANSFTGNGAGLANVNADTLGTLPASAFWQLGGNAGTAAGVNFVGTRDVQPLEFKVNNMRALRLEPNTNGAPNVIGGSPMNYVLAGAVGTTISGGGAGEGMGSNSVSCDFATIGGGLGNTIDDLQVLLLYKPIKLQRTGAV